MMITDSGTIVQLRMNEISILKRITSGVKMIDLNDGMKVAKIAKVREKISDGEQEYDNIEDAIQNIPEIEDEKTVEDMEVMEKIEDTESADLTDNE